MSDYSDCLMLDSIEYHLFPNMFLFPGVNVTFTFTPPGSFPSGAVIPYNSIGFSQMCLAGAEEPGGAEHGPANVGSRRGCRVVPNAVMMTTGSLGSI